MRKKKPILHLILLVSWLFVMAGCSEPAEQESGTDNGSEITIYYGLNGSASRSWAQIKPDGAVGVSYFQRLEGSHDQGTLFYETFHPDGSRERESIIDGTRLEKSVLLYDPQSNPHIFVARSDDTDQVIDHYARNNNGQWQSETIINFRNEGGKRFWKKADFDNFVNGLWCDL